MSTLFVDTINEKTSGNGIKIPGHVVQVQTYLDNSTSAFQTSSGSYVTSAGNLPSLSITPKYSDSKILIIAHVGMQHDAGGQIENTIFRIVSGQSNVDLSDGNTYGLCFKGTSEANGFWVQANISVSDTPGTTSQVTYTWYARSESSNNIYANHAGSSNAMTLMEIAQ